MPTKITPIDVQQIIDFKKRRHVRWITTAAISRGALVRPTTCDMCECASPHISAHHRDYGQPLNVDWLCRRCHGLVHRSDHALNPKNNSQSPLPQAVEKYSSVSVTFSLPIRNFLAIKFEAAARQVPISDLVREQVVQRFPVIVEQLEFDFGSIKNEKSTQKTEERAYAQQK